MDIIPLQVCAWTLEQATSTSKWSKYDGACNQSLSDECPETKPRMTILMPSVPNHEMMHASCACPILNESLTGDNALMNDPTGRYYLFFRPNKDFRRLFPLVTATDEGDVVVAEADNCACDMGHLSRATCVVSLWKEAML